MQRTLFTIFSVLLVLAIILLLQYSGVTIGMSPVSGHGTAFAQEDGLSRVIFKVKCYDEGKSALQGLKGIQKIEIGIHYLQETDTVYYNPNVITIEDMERALKKAGTYVETIKEKERN